MKENIFIEVNHEVLIWARESIALSKNKVIERTSISSNRLNQIETGEKQPSLEELKELSKVYKRTIATLLLNKAPVEKSLPIDRRTINSENIEPFHEKTIIAIRKARALVNSLIELKEDANSIIPKFNYNASINDNPSIIANKIYSEWKLNELREIDNNNLVLDAYIEKIESSGIAVFQLSLTQDNLRGFSIVDEAIPIIGIKRGGESTTAKIFTLFHELGHIILNDGGICDLSENSNQQIEKWCNAFASEILIPKEELLTLDIVIEQKNKGEKIWYKRDLIELGNYFHVGPLAILRSLLENKLTTISFYNEKHLAWNKPTFGRAKKPEGRNIAKETIQEKGRAYVSLAFSAYDKNRIDIKDLSDFLGIKLSYIPKTRQLLNV